ncbi:hypothetical protein [endosymbiont of Ridgeia piscesae]|jgi:hypothetical protein|uniref:YbgF trimerisation domain-containing protein n=1 Tax=endosymbiont of Ridgeia piscesae TaxID=54398 RepID=A0A0T5YZU0_9GAMM|nr:hypothetical protein [endosymbiont of Ridgeia piscesae]KRT56029.1 hypothetical protein Ga0074115_13012 [endosymbiont of Ridgeia piscesae]KRT57344.1 hypothetical protein Ga0076813_113417 [endosymbiont of Ridgeia piscesae]
MSILPLSLLTILFLPTVPSALADDNRPDINSLSRQVSELLAAGQRLREQNLAARQRLQTLSQDLQEGWRRNQILDQQIQEQSRLYNETALSSPEIQTVQTDR